MANLDEVEQIADPVERAREVGRRMAEIPVVHARLKTIRQAAVLQMKASGMSYADIGRAIGLHRNRVQQILEGRSSGGQGGSTKTEEQPHAVQPQPEAAAQDIDQR